MANSSFFKADSQTIYLLIGICLVTGLYFYNNYQGQLLRDMYINKVEITANNSLLGGPISKIQKLMRHYNQKIIKEQSIHFYHLNAHINTVIHQFKKFIIELLNFLLISQQEAKVEPILKWVY